jgi:hypothetical protein
MTSVVASSTRHNAAAPSGVQFRPTGRSTSGRERGRLPSVKDDRVSASPVSPAVVWMARCMALLTFIIRRGQNARDVA